MKDYRIKIYEDEVEMIMAEMRFAAEGHFAILHQAAVNMDYEEQLNFNGKHNAIVQNVDRIQAILTGHRPHRKLSSEPRPTRIVRKIKIADAPLLEGTSDIDTENI